LSTQRDFRTPSAGLAIEEAKEARRDLEQEWVLEVGADLSNDIETQTSPRALEVK